MEAHRISFEIAVSDLDDSSEIAYVSENLRLYVEEKFGPANKRAFTAIARDSKQKVIGGLKGFSHWRWLYINQLWVDQNARASGIGKSLLEAAEKEARARGDRGLYVDTFEAKTRDFYLRAGYREIGAIQDFPVGTSRYYLAKHL